MHIPDGFLSPKAYGPSYAVAGILWAVAVARLRTRLDEEIIPRLSVMAALCFLLNTIMIPLPGGSSVHASGIALLAVLFGLWTTYLAVSLVLLLQAILIGEGGITVLATNAVAMGIVGAGVSILTHRALRGFHPRIAIFAAGWSGTVASAACLALLLGVQPALAHRADGTPLFFPFPLRVTIPAILVPHLILGVGEGILCMMVHPLAIKIGRRGARV